MFGFGSLKNILKAGGNAALDEISKDVNKSTAEAGLAAAVFVMFADGNADNSEKEKIRRLMDTHKVFKGLDQGVRLKLYNDLVEQFETDYGLGKEAALDAIDKLTEVKDKRTAVLIGMAVARADGNVGDDEKKVIGIICQHCGLQASEFLEG